MDDKQLLVAEARALGGKDWQWWTSNSYRRLTFEDGQHTRDGSALHATIQRAANWPDVAMAPGVQEFIELASPKAVLAMAERITELEAALRPFAKEFRDWDGVGCWDEMPWHEMVDAGMPDSCNVTLADLRRAAAALDGGPAKDNSHD